jgi:hypothetical protein
MRKTTMPKNDEITQTSAPANPADRVINGLIQNGERDKAQRDASALEMAMLLKPIIRSPIGRDQISLEDI